MLILDHCLLSQSVALNINFQYNNCIDHKPCDKLFMKNNFFFNYIKINKKCYKLLFILTNNI